MKVKEESEKAGLTLNIQKTNIVAFGPITSWQIDGETMETVRDLLSWASKSLWTVTAAMNMKTLAPWRESYGKPRQHITKQRHHFADSLSSQSYGFSSSHVQMWEVVHKEGWRIDAF